MKKNDFIKLNKYLNDIFNYLEKSDKYLFICLNDIYNISKHINDKFSDLYFDEDEITNNLSFIDVIYHVENIIKYIDSKYIPIFRNVINNGELNFSYNKEEEGNYFLNKDDVGIINIDREYNYQDVINLSHEFSHYLCNKGKGQTELGYLLDEFIGRYFEIQAVNYLINNGFKENEIKASYYLEYLFDNNYEFMNYYPLLLMYYNFGSIDNDSKNLFIKYFYNINLKKFDEMCLEKLDLLEYIKKEFIKECDCNGVIMNEEDIIYEISKVFSEDYRYILGTVLALYPFDKKDIIDFVDNINTKKYENTNLFEILKKLNIDIRDNSFKKSIDNSIKKYYKSIKKVM